MRTATKATASAATENATASAVKMSTRRSRASASCGGLLERGDRALELRRELLDVRRLLRDRRLQLGDLLLHEVGLVGRGSGLRLVNAGLPAERMSPTCGRTALRAGRSQLAIKR